MNNQEDGTEGGQGATENNFCSNFSRALETALKIKKKNTKDHIQELWDSFRLRRGLLLSGSDVL